MIFSLKKNLNKNQKYFAVPKKCLSLWYEMDKISKDIEL